MKGTSSRHTHHRRPPKRLTSRGRPSALEAAEPLEGPPEFMEVLYELATTLAVIVGIALFVNVILDLAPLG